MVIFPSTFVVISFEDRNRFVFPFNISKDTVKPIVMVIFLLKFIGMTSFLGFMDKYLDGCTLILNGQTVFFGLGDLFSSFF